MNRTTVAAIVCLGFALPVTASADRSGTTRGADRNSPIVVGAAMRARVQKPSEPSMIREASSRLLMEEMAEGEVRKVDDAAGKLTLRHAGLEKLDTPPMTMVFRVRDPAWLHRLNVGDKVRFHADRVDSNLAVTALSRDNR